LVNGTLSGKLGQIFGPAVDGDTVVVTFKADATQNGYGFDIDGAEFE
jgi:hypothetical protein